MLELKFLNAEKIEKREYQFADAEQIIQAGQNGKNCGLVYPTGMGKTITAFLVADAYLAFTPPLAGQGKVLILAPTNPLCEQHFRDAWLLFNLPAEEINLLVGRVSVKKRFDIWRKSRIIVSTPQTIVGEMDCMRIDFENVAFVIFDEMHMANKNYAYVKVAEWCKNRNIRVLGLTASPGKSERIDQTERNFGVNWWVYRSAEDEEARRFVFPKNEKPLIVSYPEPHRGAMRFLRRCILFVHNEFAKSGLISSLPLNLDFDTRIDFYRLTELNEIYPRVKRWVEKQKREKSNELWYRYVALYGAYYRLMHLLNLFVTEDYRVALNYIDEISKQLIQVNASGPYCFPYYKMNPAKIIWENLDFHDFRLALLAMVQAGQRHPKLEKFLELIAPFISRGEKVLVFSNFKQTVDILADELKARGIKALAVAGNAFMKANEQKAVLDKFRHGECSVLAATTVIEAGIHVPKIDVVVNYSMPLTGIAQIQRGGRAGRTAVGLIYYLIMDNSNDSSLFYAARSENKKLGDEMRRRMFIQRAESKGEDMRICRAKPAELPLDFSIQNGACFTSKRKSKGSRASLGRPVGVQMDLFIAAGVTAEGGANA
ncbi:DEAD/DEAH box helicase family protein [Candidatus Falkowbacteria bacterium]|nr:DEAD/DEAH box helicase family protein [Candidatus Falkowbacteria bacterium]